MKAAVSFPGSRLATGFNLRYIIISSTMPMNKLRRLTFLLFIISTKVTKVSLIRIVNLSRKIKLPYTNLIPV